MESLYDPTGIYELVVCKNENDLFVVFASIIQMFMPQLLISSCGPS